MSLTNSLTKEPPAAGSFAELWRIAVPMVLSSGSLSLMFVVDRIFLTWSSKNAIAAAMPAGILQWSFIGLLLGIVMYVNTFVAQYEGAKRHDRVVAAVWQGIYLAAIGGLLMLLLIPFSKTLFELTGHTAEVQELETVYFSILCFGALPTLLSTALFSFYTGRGKTHVVMWVNFGVAITNVVLDYFLIFGHGPFPEWGIAGAAVATVIAQIGGTIAYFVMFFREQSRYDRNAANGFTNDSFATWEHRAFDWALSCRLMRYGFPAGVQLLSDISGFAIFIFLVGQIGTNELAATNLAFNLNSLAFVPMHGFGMAVATLVGKRIGEGRPELAVRTTWLSFRCCTIYMLCFIAIYLGFPDFILSPYSAEMSPEEFAPLREIVVNLLRFVAIFSLFDGMAIVFGAAIRGAGDTRFSLIYTFLTGWLIMVMPIAIIWKWFDKNLFAAWIACTIYIMFLGVGFFIRFQMGQWKSMRVIESAEELQGTSETVAAVSDNTVSENKTSDNSTNNKSESIGD